MTLVQELRAQLERVVRDPGLRMYAGVSWAAEAAIDEAHPAVAFDHERWPTQSWRIATLTAAIRAAVVTREAQP